MASWRGLFGLTFMCLLMRGRGQGDFDLADALDDPEPTKKPSSDIYPKPKPPYPPRPGHPGNGGNVYPYPRPKPPVHPQPGSYDNSGGFLSDRDLNDGRYPPRPRPPAGGGGGGGGYHPSHGGYGNPSGGGDYSTYGNPQGNTIAKIVSPIVSVVVVTLVGAAASYFQYNRRRNCFRTNEPQNV
uniref:Glycoprotein Xg n=1 Tax=Sus scrofa TaxID=9823 RepID=A0A4X1TWY7_PIG